MQEQIKRTDKIKRTINVFINDKVKTKIKGAKNESSNSKSKKS